MVKQSITIQKLKKDLAQVANQPISKAWKGYGSALFLELGELHKELAWEKDGKPTTSLTGELTLSSDGAWKLLRDSKVLLDAENVTGATIEKALKNLEKQIIKSVELTSNLTLHLSNNDVLEFNKADYGYFTLVLNEKPQIGFEGDKPYITYTNV